MTPRDYADEYEAAHTALKATNSPLLRPHEEWSLEEAQTIARQAFETAPNDHRRARLITEARDLLRAAKTPRRLEGIRKRRPDIAEVIDEELDWLAYHTVDWDRLPFDIKVRDWIDISAMPNSSMQFRSTRGTGPTWPGIREAAFVLIDWHTAAKGKAPSIGWLGNELSSIQPELKKRSEKDGSDRAKKLARQMLGERRKGKFRPQSY